MTKYHVRKDGVPDKCNAKIVDCPLGGSNVHFDNLSDAQKYADFRNELDVKVENNEISLEEAKKRAKEKYNISAEEYEKTMFKPETESTKRIVLFNKVSDNDNSNLKQTQDILQSARKKIDADYYLIDSHIDGENGREGGYKRIDNLEECLTEHMPGLQDDIKLEIKNGDLYLIGSNTKGGTNYYRIRKVKDDLNKEDKYKMSYDNFDYMRENGYDAATSKIGKDVIDANKKYKEELKNKSPKKTKDSKNMVLLDNTDRNNSNVEKVHNMLKGVRKEIDADYYLIDSHIDEENGREGGYKRIDNLEECLTEHMPGLQDDIKLEIKNGDLYLIGSNTKGGTNYYRIRKVKDDLNEEDKYKMSYDNFDYMRENGYDAATSKIGADITYFSEKLQNK